MSTARSYLSMGRGVVHVQDNSPNDIELSEAEGINVASYRRISDLGNNFNACNIEPLKNKDKINGRFEAKYHVLKKIYGN